MTIIARNIMATVLLVSLFGCATTPVPTSSAENVPVRRVLDRSFLIAKDGYGQVIVKRDGGLQYGACNSRVYANGMPVADISTGEKVTFYLPEGQNIIGAEATQPLCGGGLVETKVTVVRSRPAIFRVGYGTNGDFFIKPTAF